MIVIMNIIKKNDYKCIANKINTQKKLLEDKNKKTTNN